MGVCRVVWQTLRNFGRETSIAGLNNAAKAKSHVRALVWMAVFVSGTYLTIDGIVYVVEDFLSNPYLTSTSLSYKTSARFPAITVCNHNRIHCLNLLSEIVYQAGRDAAAKKKAQTTIESLNLLWQDTGCQEQVCASIEEAIDSDRNDQGNYTLMDQLVVYQVDLACPKNGFLEEQSCYQLLHMMEEANGTSNSQSLGTLPDSSLVQAAWAYFECSEDKACSFEPKDKKLQEEYIKPASCPLPQQPPQGGGDPQPPSGPARRRRRANLMSDLTALEVDDFVRGLEGLRDFNDRRAEGDDGQDELSIRRKKRATKDDPPDPKPDPNDPNALFSEGDVDPNAESEAEFLATYMALSDNVRAKIGHKVQTSTTLLGEVKSFIASCTYRGRDCSDSKYWKRSLDSTYGTCFTYNTVYNDRDNQAPRTASLTGMGNGFVVELFLDQDNYMLNKLSKKAGARMVVHDPYHAAYPDEDGIDMRPNTASSTAVMMNEIVRLAAPFETNCTEDWSETSYNVTSGVKYSLTSCRRFCMQEEIVAQCECAHPNLHQSMVEDESEATSVRTCFVSTEEDNEDFSCFNTILSKFNSGKKTCDCNAGCSETQYLSAVSTATWPSNQYWVDLGIDLGYDREDLEARGPEADEIKTQLQEDYARADVYFQSLNVQTVEQTKKYSTKGFFSSLGGALSLYLGVAIIMCFELIELMCDVFLNVWTYRNNPKGLNKQGGGEGQCCHCGHDGGGGGGGAAKKLGGISPRP